MQDEVVRRHVLGACEMDFHVDGADRLRRSTRIGAGLIDEEDCMGSRCDADACKRGPMR
jgi:hypothetical protein